MVAKASVQFINQGTGMGSLMALTAATSNYAMLWSAIVLLAVTASLFYALVQTAERRVLQTFDSEQLAV